MTKISNTLIPDGCALVPVEPTESMVVQGFESWPHEGFSSPEVWEAYCAMSGCQQAAHRAKLCWAAMLASAPDAPLVAVTDNAWQPIETAPKGKKLLAGYLNKLGNWRTITARYYLPKTLPCEDDRADLDNDGYAPEGWYEESESHETILLTDEPPTHWMPLPSAPGTAGQVAPQATVEPLTDERPRFENWAKDIAGLNIERDDEGNYIACDSTGDAWDAWQARAVLATPTTSKATRQELQKDGKHPSPCARFCESTAYEIEIRSLKAQLLAATSKADTAEATNAMIEAGIAIGRAQGREWALESAAQFCLKERLRADWNGDAEYAAQELEKGIRALKSATPSTIKACRRQDSSESGNQDVLSPTIRAEPTNRGHKNPRQLCTSEDHPGLLIDSHGCYYEMDQTPPLPQQGGEQTPGKDQAVNAFHEYAKDEYWKNKMPAHRDREGSFFAGWDAHKSIHGDAVLPQGGEEIPPDDIILLAIKKQIHYPECWDTAAYPNLASALAEFNLRCSECTPAIGGEEKAVAPEGLIERLHIHADNKANTAFARSTMREVLEILAAPVAQALPVAAEKDTQHLQIALENLMDYSEPPEKNCSCHISPPCTDCVENSGWREAYDDARSTLIGLQGENA